MPISSCYVSLPEGKAMAKKDTFSDMSCEGLQLLRHPHGSMSLRGALCRAVDVSEVQEDVS